MIELKVIDDFFLGIAPHFFIVMLILIEDPFEIGNPLSKLDLFPYFPIIHDAANKVLIIIAIDNSKSELFWFGNFIYL